MMNKNLPKVFVVPMDKKLNNNKDIFMSKEESFRKEKEETIDINEINKIFNSKNHVYKTRVFIKTQKKQEEVDLIGLKKDNLLTLDGKLIPLTEILEIKKV